MGENLNCALCLIRQTENKYKSASLFKKSDLLTVFYNVHYVPLNQFGANLVQLLTLPDCHNYLLSLVYDDESLKRGSMSLVHDIVDKGIYTLSLLDYNLRRLILTKSHIASLIKEGKSFTYQILCFPEQVDELYQYFGNAVTYLTVNIDELIKCLYEEE